MRSQQVTFRSVTYRVYAGIIWALLAAVGAGIVFTGGQGLAALPTFVALALVTWVGLWRPRLEIDDDGATVVNPLVRVRVPFEALIDVSTKWSLTLVTPSRRVAVFCAPQPGRFVSWRVQRRIRREGDPHERKALDQGVHVGALPGTESGDAAAVVRERWQRALDDDRVTIGAADATSLDRRIDVLAGSVLTCSFVLAVLGSWIVASLI